MQFGLVENVSGGQNSFRKCLRDSENLHMNSYIRIHTSYEFMHINSYIK